LLSVRYERNGSPVARSVCGSPDEFDNFKTQRSYDEDERMREESSKKK
jgi:hypothetical protein